MEKTRERSKNFKESEISILLHLVKNKKAMLESKKTDQVGQKDKELAWETVATDFNNASGIYYRDAKTLRSKYENLKKTTKRKFADEKSYVMGTGGGPPLVTEITDTDVKIKDLLGDLTVLGGESQFDSDAVAQRSSTPKPQYDLSDLDINTLPVILEENTIFLGDGPSRPTRNTVDFGDNAGLGLSVQPSGSFNDENEVEISGSLYCGDESSKPPENKRELAFKPFNMRDLRNKKSSPLKLSRNKRKNILDASVAGKKIEAISKAKDDLIQLQKELYTKQVRFLEEEHEEKMDFMKKEHKKQLELLDLKLQKNKFKMSMLEKSNKYV